MIHLVAPPPLVARVGGVQAGEAPVQAGRGVLYAYNPVFFDFNVYAIFRNTPILLLGYTNIIKGAHN